MNGRRRTRRTVVCGGLSVAAVLLCVAAWQCWGGASSVAVPGVGRGTAPAVATMPSTPPSLTNVPSVAVEREVAAAEPSTSSQTLRIVDEHGAPVVDALVAVALEVPKPSARLPHVDVEIGFADLLRYRSGGDGTVMLPGAAFERFVLAREGTRFGCAVVRFDPLLPMPELVVAEDCTLRVRVVGPDGSPRAAVPVEVIWCNFRSPFGNYPNRAELRSDANGMATVWHAQALDHWDLAAAEVELTARVFGADAEGVRVPLRRPVPAVVDVPCAAHGSLRVRARLPAGSVVPWRVTCEVAPLGEQATRRSLDVESELELPAVALGREWTFEANGLERRQCAGPVADREQVVVLLGPSPTTRDWRRRGSYGRTVRRQGREPCTSAGVVLGGARSAATRWGACCSSRRTTVGR